MDKGKGRKDNFVDGMKDEIVYKMRYNIVD